MSETEMMNMHQPVSPHQPSPSSQVHSEIYSRYHPNVAKRMQADECYKCKQIGHWSWDCPLKSPNGTKSLSPSVNHVSSSTVRIWCRCGHGLCEEKIALNDRNRGKKYFLCPIKRGKKCTNFVKWCDGGNIDESDLQPPPYKYPECVCGAGVCRKENATGRPHGSEYYFTCPVPENHGSCGYRVWEDELLDNNKAIVPIQQQSGQRTNALLEVHQNEQTDCDISNGGDLLLENSESMRVMDNSENSSLDNNKAIVPIQQQSSQRTNALLEVHQNEQTDCDMSNGGDLLLENSESMRVMNNSENSSLVVVSDLPDREDNASPKADPSKCVDFSDFKVADYLQDLEYANSLSTKSHFDFALSTLIITPIFPGVFPSFNPIDVPKQASIGDVPCERSQLAVNSLSQQTQISTSCDNNEVSGDADTPDKSPASSERKPMSKAERRRQMVLVAQQQLLIDLETFDPNEQREAAEATFDMLDNLGVNYKQFAEHVWEYIDLASSIAEMDNSIEYSINLEEYNNRFEEEKVRFARIQDDCFNTETSLEESNQRRRSLIEEISQLEAMLNEKQTELKSCESENLQIETHLGELRRNLVEAETTLKVTAEEAEIARQLDEEREAKQISAKTALEKAKLESEN